MELASALYGVHSAAKLGMSGIRALSAGLRSGGDEAIRAIAGSVDEYIITARGNAVPATKFGGTASNNMGKMKVMSKSLMKQKGLDGHAFKAEVLGTNKNISHWDVMYNTATKEISLISKTGEVLGTGMSL